MQQQRFVVCENVETFGDIFLFYVTCHQMLLVFHLVA
jgi:hypothetical protein